MTTTSANILDNLAQIQKQDADAILAGIDSLADQITDAWQQVSNSNISIATGIENVVIVGMGGSSLGADFWHSVLFSAWKKPVTIINDYVIPSYVNEKSLVILVSVSGTTEEVLSAASAAAAANAQIVAMAAGGQLIDLANKNSWPHYQIKATKNPSKQGRVAIGYVLIGIVGILSKTGVIDFSQQQVAEIVTTVITYQEKYGQHTPTAENAAKTLAYQLIDREISLIGADFLAGPLHLATNQLHETSKTLAKYYVLPELNHHLMEGLRYPDSSKHHQLAVFVESNLYHPRNSVRLDLSKKVWEMADIDTLSLDLTEASQLTQAFEFVVLMSYTSFYLSMLEGIDPGALPTVDWFKKNLA